MYLSILLSYKFKGDYMKRIVCFIIAVSTIISVLTMPMAYADEDDNNIINYKNHSLYLDSNGDLYAWGYNAFAQLGDGSYTNCSSPKKIMSDVKAFSIGGNHSLALKTDGSLWSWGSNAYAQLGMERTVTVQHQRR